MNELPERPSIDFHRKRAKALLRDARRGQADAWARIAAHHPGSPVVGGLLKLADAQVVVARELGFPSWPQLKAHIDVLTRVQHAIDGRVPPSGEDLETVHLRCGADIQDALAKGGFLGRFVEFSDPLCQGPVLAISPREYLNVRANFITYAYEMDFDAAFEKLAAQRDGLERAGRSGHVVFWAEHDPFDQLILACMLAAFESVSTSRLEMICVDAYPGVGRFRGLGQLTAARLRELWDRRRPMTAAGVRLGHAVWDRLRRDDPRPLWALARSPCSPLPAMAAALSRHLRELPDVNDGLSLTERLTLEVLLDGSRTGSELFARYSACEPLVHLGDVMFFYVVRELASGRNPAISVADWAVPWSERQLSITELGRALLAKKADWVAEGGRERWVGGIRVGDSVAPWRWDQRLGPVRGR